MKKITILSAVFLSVITTNAYAAGGKVRPPVAPQTENSFSDISVFNAGGKVRPPAIVSNAGGKVRPPVIISDAGGKVRPPTGGIVATDSGASTLSHLLSKYFGF